MRFFGEFTILNIKGMTEARVTRNPAQATVQYHAAQLRNAVEDVRYDAA